MRKRNWWRFSRVLLFVLLGASLTTVILTGRFWWQQQVNRPSGSAATPEALKEKLETYEKRADELEKLLTILLGLSTVYAVALAFGAYQQLKDSADRIENLREDAQKKIDQLPAELASIRKDASERIGQQLKDSAEKIEKLREDAQRKIDQLPGELANIRKEGSEDMERFVENLVSKIQGKFPLFADMDDAIRVIMDRLMHLLPVIDWSDEDYRRLDSQAKQSILFYEKTVAAFEYFDLQGVPRTRETVSEIYHGLGNFYGLRYGRESHQEEDRERSRFYLERAIQYNPANTGALNDRGFLAVNLDKPPDYAKARDVFTRSLDSDGEQQRARYNLAYVEHADRNYTRAEKLLTEALVKKHWQGRLPARHRLSILYNRACAYARLAETDGTQKQACFDKALADLAEVYAPGVAWGAELLENFKKDVEVGGDLYSLTLENPWKEGIEGIRARLP